MQKLSGNSSGKNNKSCRFFHQQSTKLGLHYSEFSTVFYAFYKNQQIGNTIEDSNFPSGHWNYSKPHNHALSLLSGP
jgi:hypothetical protein